MPELPEVETVVNAIKAGVIGRKITYADTTTPKQIAPYSLAEFNARIKNQAILNVWRRAKYIVCDLDGGDSLIVHLRMTGHLSTMPQSSERHKYVRTWFGLSDGHELRFRDLRKFGTINLVGDPMTVLGKLGPEPLSDAFTPAVFRERLARRTTKMKPLLLNQTFVAGIGNIYADEALFNAKIGPRRTADTLTEAEIDALYHAIRHVLQLGIDREGASISDYVKPDGKKGDMQNAVEVFRRTGSPCYTCGTPIERIKLAQRSTHFCPVCQK